MNPHLNYYLAQAHTADLLREAQRPRRAGLTRDRRRATQTAIRRTADRVSRADTTGVALAWAGREVDHPNKAPCGDGLDPRCAASTARADSPAMASATAKSDG